MERKISDGRTGGRSLLWVALGVLAMGLVNPENILSLRIKNQGSLEEPNIDTYTLDEPKWQLVEDSGGFRTFVSRVPGSNILALRGQAIVNEHIGRLYSAFLNTTSTLDWVRYLVEVEELPVRSGRWQHGGGVGGAGGVLFQRFDMPWPVKDREVVLERILQVDKRAKKMVATYHSTEHPARPIGSSAIRAIVHRTIWSLTALEGSRTAIDFETRADPRGALPGAIVSFLQKRFLKDTVYDFVRTARREPIHSAMAKW